MDGVDPLRDSRPSRYAVESDDSEDELGQGLYPASQPRTATKRPDPVVSLQWTGATEVPLIVAVGAASRQWALGLPLSEDRVSIVVDAVEIGSIHQLAGSKVHVLLASHAIPALGAYAVTKSLFSSLKPSRIVIVDKYAVPSFIHISPVDSANAPIRYLTTRKSSFTPGSAKLFASPNLIQGLSAALLNYAEMWGIAGELFLLPSSHTSPPLHSQQAEPLPLGGEWEDGTIAEVNKIVFSVLGQGDVRWDAGQARAKGGFKMRSASAKRGDIGDGGMYI